MSTLYQDNYGDPSCICVGHKGAYVRDPECPVCSAEEPDPVTAPACPVCGGPTNHMGDLGRRSHYRCCNCGMDTSVRVA